MKTPKKIPYGRHTITDDDIDAVVATLKSDWLSQGPKTIEFECLLAQIVGTKYAVACSSGTAALHLAMLALDIGPDDIVVTSPITFLASANCARFVGAQVWFTDVDPDTGLMCPNSLKSLLEKDNLKQIKAVIPVDYAGQPANLPEIYELAKNHGAYVVEDACHALGARYSVHGDQYPAGSCQHADISVFSFHPIKHITTGEGGALLTNNANWAEKARLYRSHGMVHDNFENPELAFTDGEVNPWYYEMQVLGYNYRLSDLQAALGIQQLKKLEQFVQKRRELANTYRHLIEMNFDPKILTPVKVEENKYHSYHLFPVFIDFNKLGLSRQKLMLELRKLGIETQVNYIPVFLQPYYKKLNTIIANDGKNALRFYNKCLSLPIYPKFNKEWCQDILTGIIAAADKTNATFNIR